MFGVCSNWIGGRIFSITCVAGLFLPAVCLGQGNSYTISTVAGNNTAGYNGDGRTATGAELNGPSAVMVDGAHTLYIADSANQRIREVISGKISTVAGTGAAAYSGDGAKATAATLSSPYGMALDSAGNLYIADLANQVVRQVNTSGVISTVVGTNQYYGFAGDGGPATSAKLNHPFGLAIDSAGNLYVSDSNNNRVRKVAADQTITTYAGNGWNTYQGDGGPASSASVNAPYGLAVDTAGNLYIADSANHRIRKVSAADGTITTVAGNGTAGFSGDGGPATSAQLYRPFGVAVDANGNIFIADYLNSRIREVTTDGTIYTVAGYSASGYAGDGGEATSAKLNLPTGVAVDNEGKVYIADFGNDVIRMLTPSAPSVASGGVVSAAAFGGFSTVAPGSWIEIYGTNLAFSRRSWTTKDFSGANAPTALDGTSVTIGGKAAFVDFVSGGQVNAQVPSGVSTGSQSLVVTSPAGTTSSYAVTVNASSPGLLAPSSFKIGGTQYVAAQFTDGTTYVLPPGAISGVTAKRAKAGDTIVLYGVGFGSVSPSISAGQIVQQTNNLVLPLTISFGQTPATVNYAGLAPNAVGLYQFNVVVPNVTASDTVPLTFTLGGVSGAQTLAIAVQ